MQTQFVIKGIAPPGLSRLPDSYRLKWWSIVTELGLRRKDWELAQGLNARGKPLPNVSEKTRKNRRSEMTLSGRGDPTAPYLMPARGLSRTRSLLAGRPELDRAVFFWRFDERSTGDEWGKVLAYHARRGRAYDVIGLSPKGLAWVKAHAMKRWTAWLQSKGLPPEPPKPQEVIPIRVPLYPPYSGPKTAEQWRRELTTPRPAARRQPGMAPSAWRGLSNILLQYLWGT